MATPYQARPRALPLLPLAASDPDRALALKLQQDPVYRARVLRELGNVVATQQLELYHPYEKQAAFHAAGRDYRERALLAGNQIGKTYSAGAETAYHLTGLYPPWWQGRRFNRQVAGWAAGVTSEATRDTAQRILLGRAESLGTGLVPKRLIKET